MSFRNSRIVILYCTYILCERRFKLMVKSDSDSSSETLHPVAGTRPATQVERKPSRPHINFSGKSGIPSFLPPHSSPATSTRRHSPSFFISRSHRRSEKAYLYMEYRLYTNVRIFNLYIYNNCIARRHGLTAKALAFDDLWLVTRYLAINVILTPIAM